MGKDTAPEMKSNQLRARAARPPPLAPPWLPRGRLRHILRKQVRSQSLGSSRLGIPVEFLRCRMLQRDLFAAEVDIVDNSREIIDHRYNFTRQRLAMIVTDRPP
jgi:hypothetical protein